MRRGDPDRVLEERRDQVVVGRVVLATAPSPSRSIDRQYAYIQAVASDCSSRPGDRQVRPVEGAQVVEPEEAAREQVVALVVLAVQPPREVHQQLVEDPLQELRVAPAVDLPDLQRRERRGPAG